MKKLLIVLLVVICSFSLFAASEQVFDFDIGFNASFRDGALSTLRNLEKISLDDLNFGIEVRTKLLFLQVSAAGDFGVTDSRELLFNGLFLFGISEDILGFSRVGFSMGPKVEYVTDGKSVDLIIDGHKIEDSSLFTAFAKSDFNLRFTMDFFLGPVIKIGLAYCVPTEFSLEKGDLNLLIPTKSACVNGNICLGLTMTLF